jgi:hypothetical protein
MNEDKKLILDYVGLEEWNDNQKISMLNTVAAFQTNPIKIKYDKYGHRIDPRIEVKQMTLKDLLNDKELIKTLRNE